jgi:SET family sugar efflux transporter-like MFS transporter
VSSDRLHVRDRRATTLFANATTAGALVAGVLAGAAVRWYGYTTALVLCGVAAAVSTATFAAGTAVDARHRRTSQREVSRFSPAGSSRPR